MCCRLLGHHAEYLCFLPGFDVDDEDVETQKVHNAVARVRFINEEIASRVQTKHYNCHEGALPFTKSYFLSSVFQYFPDVS